MLPLLASCGIGLCVSEGICSTAFAPGEPLSFALKSGAPGYADITWARSIAEYPGAQKQQVLLFQNSECSGDPTEIVEVESGATTLAWNRVTANLGGTLRFRVRGVFSSGSTADSGCSGEIKLRNSAVIFAGTENNLRIGVNKLTGDVTGDGVPDIIVWDGTFDANKGYIGVLEGGVHLASNTLKVYRGSAAQDGVGGNLQLVDVNGDGILDIASSSHLADPEGRADAGSIYVILGQSTMPASGTIESVGYRYDGPTAGDGLGLTSLWVHDITGDGIPEMMSQVLSNALASNGGALFVIVGSDPPPPSSSSGVHFRRYGGPFTNGYLGGNLKFGDFNGDGIDDLVGASSLADMNISDEGVVYMILGAATLPASGSLLAVGTRYEGDLDNDQIGSHGFHVTDVTGDGKAEILVGAPNASAGALNGGAMYIIPGQTTPPANNLIGNVSLRYAGNTGLQFAGNLNTAPMTDVTGDGIKDIIAASGGTATSQIYVILGASSLPASGNIQTRGTYYTPALNFGSISLQDFNGDGTTDILVNTASLFGSTTGECYFYFGGPSFPASGTMAATANAAVSGDMANQYFSIYSPLLPGFLPSGQAGFYAGSVNSRPVVMNSGAFFAIPGGAALPTTGLISAVGMYVSGEFAEDRLGNKSSFGDLNGDGKPDYVSSYGSASPSAVSNAGSLYLIGAGAASGPISTVGRRFNGSVANDRFAELYEVIDVNADGKDDVIVTSRLPAYSLKILYGQSSFSAMTPETIASPELGDGTYIGASLIGVDVTGDGVKDLVSFGYNGTIAESSGGLTANGAIYVLPSGFLAIP